MKRTFFTLILICLTIWSCKKEKSKDTMDTGDKSSHKVTFSVGFSKQSADFETNSLKVNSTNRPLTTQALADQVDVIYLAVYKSDGKRAFLIKQLSTDIGFGAFTEELTTGNYTVVFAAGKTGLTLSNEVSADSTRLTKDILAYPGAFNQDAFYKKILLTIPGDASQAINLDRITSKMQVIIEDAIPSNVKAMGVTVKQVGYKFYVGSGTAAINNSGLSLKADFTPADIGTLNYSFNTGSFLAVPKSNVVIYSSSRVLPFADDGFADISRIVVSNVVFMPNKKTVLTGILFGGGTNGFQLVADTSWNGTHINKPF